MLVLSRKQSQSIVINGDIRVTVVSIRGNQVRIGIEAPNSVRIFREELCEATRPSYDETLPAGPGAAGDQVTCGSTNNLGHQRRPSSLVR